MSAITLFGLGTMGKALAAAPLVEKGAKLATTVAEGLETSDVIILCLLDNVSVRQTLGQATTALKGKTVVNLTNGTPSQARETSEWVVSHGAEYIHGGIMAVPDMIGSPHAVLLYSGQSTEAFSHVEAHLNHLGTSKFLGTDPGSASLHDLALLSGIALAKQIDDGDYATQGSSLAMQVAGVGNMVKASEEAGVTVEMIMITY
ncbi:hypothetical protein BJX62DRAFT_242232 [Aspergillus germanicus]